ncbi:MAG: hypothetical protein F4Y82_00385 [Cenarchaeum sp. SB0665_bin_23]|nr:hypothetical protein [Cenarchaeum sp. SB0665_bin_23]MYG33135.1 hypothetical protein [Cenarchaeum sp. SB0677_bin_16]
MENAVVYGFSTEGYSLASRLVERRIQVHLIDETLSSAVILRPEIAKMYPDVATLNADEPLMDAVPVKVAVSEAKYLFFAPRIRRVEDDCKMEIYSKFKDAVAHMVDGSSIICNIPLGLGGNIQNLSLLKHVTGVEAGQGISYYYYPLGSGQQRGIVGTVRGNTNTELIDILDEDLVFIPMTMAEREHAISAFSKFAKTISKIEMYRYGAYVSDALPYTNETFLDDMVEGLLDLQLIKDSQDNVGHVLYLVKGGIRAIDMYIKKLVDSVKHTVREKGLKMSRTDIVVAWEVDRFSIRGDRLEVMQNLMTRLQDYTSRVEQHGTLKNFRPNRTTLVIACSKSNYEEAMARQDDMESIIIKATPTVSV